MSDPRFDPSKAVRFDLTRGLVERSEAAEPGPAQVLVPADALLALASAAGADASHAFARAAGSAMGRRVAARLSAGGAEAAAVEVAVDHLAGELALAGLGSLSLERWGRAAVLVVDQSPLGAGGDAMLEGLLAAAVEGAVANRSIHVLCLGRDGVRARFLLAGAAGAGRVRAWLAAGVAWGEALVRLHAPTRGDA